MFRPKKARNKPPAVGTRTVLLFHGVSVKSHPGRPCASVQRIEGLRFLSDDAPTLPLDACSHPQLCRCVYVHFQDRRTGSRRDTDEGLPARLYDPDRRLGAGRRVTDGYGPDLGTLR